VVPRQRGELTIPHPDRGMSRFRDFIIACDNVLIKSSARLTGACRFGNAGVNS